MNITITDKVILILVLCVSSYHHTFSDYFNAIIKAGFHILQVEEPAPPLEWKERFYNRYDSFIQTPSFLILKLVK